MSRTSTERRARMVLCGVLPELFRYPESRAISVMSP